jgi:hypothetical protein
LCFAARLPRIAPPILREIPLSGQLVRQFAAVS